MEAIVVFGATGAVGAYTSVELSKAYNVIAVGRRESDNGFFKEFGIDYISVDITQKNDFSKLPNKGVIAVVHAAGVMPAHMKGYNPKNYVNTELHGTLNILEYMVEANVKKIIYTTNSNNSLYNLGKIPVPPDIRKSFPANNDHSMYAICKNAAVDFIEHYYAKHEIKRFILKLYKMYFYHPNPYFYVNGEKQWIPYRLFIQRAIRGENIEIWGDPRKANEVVYIYDCVNIVKQAIKSTIDGGVYNVGGIAPVSFEERVNGIIQVFCKPDKTSKIIYRPDKHGSAEFSADITKTRNDLGYTPKWNYLSALNDIKDKMYANHFAKLWGNLEDYIVGYPK